MREWIDKIVEEGNQEDMEELSEILIKAVNKLKKYDEKCYNKYKMKVYEIAYGRVLTEDIAYDIVADMKPDGEHWDIDTTTSVKTQYNLMDISDVDFYVVMNMAWNDYKSVLGESVDNYVKFTKAFIKDEDAPEDKVYMYFTKVV